MIPQESEVAIAQPLATSRPANFLQLKLLMFGYSIRTPLGSIVGIASDQS